MPAPLLERTLIFVSTDAGAYGGAGATRFADTSPLAEHAIATIVLDGIGGRGRPRLVISGGRSSSPARTLVSTASARVTEQAGRPPVIPSALSQLVDLGIPYAAGEQAPFLAEGVAAITLTTRDPGEPSIPAGDPLRFNVCGIPRTARTCGRGDRRLDRHECWGHLSDPRQPLLGRAGGEWLDGTAHAGRGGRAIRARRPRSAGEGQAAGPATPPGNSRPAVTPLPVAVRRSPRVGRRCRGCLPDRRRAPATAELVVRRGLAPLRAGRTRRCLRTRLAGRPPAARPDLSADPRAAARGLYAQRSRGSARSPWWWRC